MLDEYRYDDEGDNIEGGGEALCPKGRNMAELRGKPRASLMASLLEDEVNIDGKGEGQSCAHYLKHVDACEAMSSLKRGTDM